jgi:hypothetical protein
MIKKSPLLKIFVLSIIFSSLLGCQDNDREMEETEVMLDSLSRELSEYKQKSDSLKGLLERGDLATGYPVYYGKAFDSIENPEEYIAGQLKEHPEKIPMDAVLGGTMQFRQVQVLTEDWVLAVYDDGHVQGKSIFEYELLPDDDIEFSHVASRMPE